MHILATHPVAAASAGALCVYLLEAGGRTRYDLPCSARSRQMYLRELERLGLIKRQGRGRTALIEVIDAPAGLEPMAEAIAERKLPPEVALTFMCMAAGAKSVREVARARGVAPSTAHAHMKAAAVEPARPAEQLAEQPAEPVGIDSQVSRLAEKSRRIVAAQLKRANHYEYRQTVDRILEATRGDGQPVARWVAETAARAYVSRELSEFDLVSAFESLAARRRRGGLSNAGAYLHGIFRRKFDALGLEFGKVG